MAEQDFTEIARLAERYSKDPKSRIFVQLADAYRKNNMVDEALDVLKQGLQYHPKYPLAYLILGKCYFDKRMFNQAKDAFEKTIEYDPVNIVAMRMLAQVCESLKDEACQIKAYKGIVSIDPSDEMAKNKLVQLEAGQKKEIYTLTIAQEYERQGNLKEALNVYEHLSFMDPTDLAIKQKIEELRDRISGVVKEIKKGEEKVTEMEMESYFKPEELSSAPSVEVPGVPEPQLGEHIIDLEEKTQVPVVEEEKPVIEEVKPEIATEPVSPEKAEEPEEILSLEEFLAEPSKVDEETTKEPVIEEITQAEKPKEELFATIPQETILEKPVEQPVKQEETNAEIPEIESVEPTPVDILETKIEPSAQELLVTPSEYIAETKEEPLKEPVAEPTAEPVKEVLESEKVSKTVEEKTEEQKPIPPEEKKKEEPPKPKEEDFKSFQDWLSSLLK